MHTALLAAPASPATSTPPACSPAPGSGRLRLLAWNFTLFNTLRTVSYLPTIWQIVHSGQSDQYSILTWLCFLCANASTGCWVWEANGRRIDRVVAVNTVNSLMCASVVGVIAWYRWF